MRQPDTSKPMSIISHRESALTEPAIIRWILITIALVFLGLFLVLPLITVFTEALKKGFTVYLASFNDKDTLSAIKLTIIIALVVVPLNLLF